MEQKKLIVRDWKEAWKLDSIGRRLLITDRLTNHKFLIDTRADISVIPVEEDSREEGWSTVR